MLYRLQRHPFPVKATFRHSLVLTYALPAARLQPLLPPGLRLDEWNGLGFLAIALVATEGLRPALLPAFCGADFFLAGYRVFTRCGESLRGLRILRSYANRCLMIWGGNLLTHYDYHFCHAKLHPTPGRLDIAVTAPQADLVVTAYLDRPELPASSPFPDIAIRGVRDRWDPQPVAVEVHSAQFLEAYPEARLANAFYVHDIDYRWEKGVVVAL
jgi:Uncharacterized conserved protein (COG2071)